MAVEGKGEKGDAKFFSYSKISSFKDLLDKMPNAQNLDFEYISNVYYANEKRERYSLNE